MEYKKYTFKEGTTKISAKRLADTFYNYETVEIPGSMSEVKLRDTHFYDKEKIILKELILNEGICSIDAELNGARYNIPSTLININCNGIPPRIICLKDGFKNAKGSFMETEYVQAYTSADLRYCEFSKLKHYVYLGKKKMNWASFKNLPSGCVIHVENEKIALAALEKCDVFSHYVVIDAAEWKDFPADKLKLSTEEYNPESRILPEQNQMREEQKRMLEEQERIRLEQEEEERQLDEKRQRQNRKNEIIEDMTEQVIRSALDSVSETGAQNVPKTIKFGVNTCWDDKNKCNHLSIKFLVAPNLRESRSWHRHLVVNVYMDETDVATKSKILVEHIVKIRDFLERNRELIINYDIRLSGFGWEPICPQPGICLPFRDGIAVGSVKLETIGEDARNIRDFVVQLDHLVGQGLNDFPTKFCVEPEQFF